MYTRTCVCLYLSAHMTQSLIDVFCGEVQRNAELGILLLSGSLHPLGGHMRGVAGKTSIPKTLKTMGIISRQALSVAGNLQAHSPEVLFQHQTTQFNFAIVLKSSQLC